MDVRRRKKLPQTGNKEKFSAGSSEKRNSFGFCKILLLVDLIILVSLVLGYIFSPIKARDITGWENVPLTGPFAPGNAFQSIVKLPDLFAPESIDADEEGNLYAGLGDGRVVRIKSSPDVGKGPIETLFSGVIKGADTTDGSDRGRPMGLRVRGNTLFVIDTVYGFYKIDLDSKKLTLLMRPRDLTPSMKFPNDIDITADGQYAYITDSSFMHTMKSVSGIGLLDGTCTGRVIRFNLKNNRVEIIAKDLCFANGLQLSRDEKSVIVSETMRVRVSWIDISSGKTVKNVSLPMLPDNIRLSERGTYWVTGSNVVSVFGKALLHLTPLRQAFAGLFPAKLLSLGMPFMMDVRHNIIVEIDPRGNVLRSFHDPDGAVVSGASQVIELNNNRLVVGSYMDSHASIVSL